MFRDCLSSLPSTELIYTSPCLLDSTKEFKPIKEMLTDDDDDDDDDDDGDNDINDMNAVSSQQSFF